MTARENYLLAPKIAGRILAYQPEPNCRTPNDAGHDTITPVRLSLMCDTVIQGRTTARMHNGRLRWLPTGPRGRSSLHPDGGSRRLGACSRRRPSIGIAPKARMRAS